MNDSDDDLFAQAMRHVQPMAKTPKPKAPKKKSPVKTALPTHQAPSHHIPSKPKHTSFKSLQKSHEPWVLYADGVSPDTLKKLGRGQPAITQTLDLHGMTTHQALSATEDCLQSTLLSGGRVVCIIHGRGLHSQDGRPVLKQYLYKWLGSGAMTKHILAVIPKPNTRGGSCLILLRRDKHK